MQNAVRGRHLNLNLSLVTIVHCIVILKLKDSFFSLSSILSSQPKPVVSLNAFYDLEEDEKISTKAPLVFFCCCGISSTNIVVTWHSVMLCNVVGQKVVHGAEKPDFESVTA